MKFQRAKNPSSGGRLRPLRGFSRPRGGLTLIEILMTIFVLAIGLLGVAALLPVGTFQMRQGQIAQRTAEIGGGALDTIEASGMHKPDRWLTHSGVLFDTVVDKNASNPDMDPEYVRIAFQVDPSSTASNLVATTAGTLNTGEDFYKNCLVEFVRGQNGLLTQQAVIDPSVSSTAPDFNLVGPLTPIPGSSPTSVVDIFVIKRYEPFAIDPLYVADPAHSADRAPAFVPNIDPDQPDNMKRLTLSNGLGLGVPLNLPAAEAIFQATDDLLFTPGTDAEGLEDESKLPEPPRPPKVDAAGIPSPRPSLGNYSWLATFVPVEQSGGYQDGCTYTVSVAVFYKRPLQLLSTASERTLTLAHNGGSTFTISGATFENNGGDATFEEEAGDESYIKSGLWGLVTVVAQSPPREWVERARWYRLGSVGKPDATGDVKARLIGPDWAFIEDPSITYTYQITFYEGLKGVFERTMRVPELPIGAAP